MNLVNASMAWGLLAISIPIIIHILNRQRFRIVDWAAIDLLRRALEKNRKRIKFQELLLLLLRCLAVAFLVGFLMRPVPGNFELGDRNRLRVLVVDSSASMAAQEAGNSAWDRALTFAREVVNSGDPKGGDKYMICTMGETVRLELDVTPDTLQVLEKLDNLQLSHGGSNYNEAPRKILQWTDKVDATTCEVFVFSDFQKTGLEADRFPVEKADKETWWHFHDCGARERANLAVTRLAILSSSVVKDRPVEIEVDVSNFSTAEQRTAISLFDGGVKRETRQGVDVPPGSSVTLKFTHVFSESGPQYLRASIDRDGLGVDNDHWVGLDVRDRIKVTIIDGDPGSVYYRDESFLYRNMLEIPGLFEVSVLRTGLDDFDSVDLTDLQLLVCANVSTLPPQLVERVGKWVDEGGSLLVSAGSNFDPETLGGLAELLPVLPGSRLDFDPPKQAGLTPGNHPEQAMLAAYNTLQLSVIERMLNVETRDGARVILRAAARYPLLIHHRFGSGQVAFWASSLDYEWNQVSEADYIGIFGMTSQTLVQSVLTRVTPPGSEVRFLFSTAAVGGDASLRDGTPEDAGGGGSAGRVPAQVEESGVSAQVVVDPEQIPTAGIYEIMARDGDTLGYLGVNPRSDESDLAPLDDDALVGRGDDTYLSLSRTATGLRERLSDSYPGREIWRYLAMLALVFLVVESFLATRWGNS